ncbi:hypothetical protein Cs7R123_44580 [Catellatospora sp. TT07R-123]|nr:hypothetical protein Cs7R123_44580 [Catellatospora sp. TT07R-123]
MTVTGNPPGAPAPLVRDRPSAARSILMTDLPAFGHATGDGLNASASVPDGGSCTVPDRTGTERSADTPTAASAAGVSGGTNGSNPAANDNASINGIRCTGLARLDDADTSSPLTKIDSGETLMISMDANKSANPTGPMCPDHGR